MSTLASHSRDANHQGAGAPEPLLVRAYRGQPVERIPVWFMRQAGRSLPEYHELKGSRGLLDVVRSPEDAAEITLQPIRRHGVDGAILYSDIVVPLAAMDLGVEIRPGVGPVIERPIRTAADVARIGTFDPDAQAPYVAETVRILRRELPEAVGLIGFGGAPFTLASYLVEGGPSRQQPRTKAMMLGQPERFADLLGRLADVVVASLRAQAAAGAQALQIFDSWIGSLSVAQYVAHVQPVMTRMVEQLRDLDVPIVMFGIGTGHLLEALAATGVDVVGVDWRTPLAEARTRLGEGVALQGNLDPCALLAGWDAVDSAVRSIIGDAPRRGWVFNLGHGVMPETDPEIITRVASLVHELGGTTR